MKLSNNLLSITISDHGAELQNITDNRTGHEYLWQGNPAFWGRRSPVLFPIVGAVAGGRYRIDGLTYEMGQHGFARDCEFKPVDDRGGDDEAWFALESDDSTLARYPRRFRLEIGYRLDEARISVMWRVTNCDTRDMPFQIGAHPAFNYPGFNPADDVHGYFGFDTAGPLSAQVISEGGCVGDTVADVTLDSERMLPITGATFANDALILADNQTHRLSLLDRSRAPYISLIFRSPLVGLWSPKPDAPFVCIEPWWGRCDRVGYDGEFDSREYVNILEPGKTFEAGYMIIIDSI